MGKNSIRSVFATVCLVFLYGCGAAHVRSDVASNDLTNYEFAHIKEVKVNSKEEAAKSNAQLQRKLKQWSQFADQELRSYLATTRLKIVDSTQSFPARTLVFDVDSDVRYGNRALRWVVGFGAGKGGATSVLTVTDGESGAVRYRAQSESDLAVGVAGGNMESVVKGNVKKLIEHFKQENTL